MAETFGYRVVVEWSDEDDAFIARVPALPGCAAHGHRPEEATREAVIAARAIIASMRHHGSAVPPTDVTSGHSGQLRLRLPRSLHERLTRLAAVDGVSLNQELVALLAAGAGATGGHPNRRPRTIRGRRARAGSLQSARSRS